MGSGISDGGLPTEYEKIGHEETYQDDQGKVEVIVGAVYRRLPGRKDVCSVNFASPNCLCIGYMEGGRVKAEGAIDILELARTLERVSDDWCQGTSRMFRDNANWLEMKVRSLKIAKELAPADNE